MARKKKEILTVNPYNIVFPDNNWQSVVMGEQQIFRVKTDALNLKNALVNAENPKLRNRWLLFQIFANMLVDGYLQGIIMQRQSTILQKKWKVTVNGEVNDEVVNKFNDLWFGKFLKMAHDAIIYGFSFVQITEVNDGEIMDVELVPRIYCCPEFDLIRDNYTTLTGANIYNDRFRDWIVPMYRDRTDFGELTKVADLQIKKQASLVSYSEYQEKFGTPFRVVMTDITNEDTKRQIAQMLAKMGSNAWSIIDKDDKIEFIMPSGDGSIFQTFLQYVDEQLVIALLGQSLTTSTRGKGGNRALGEVHERIANSIQREDAEWIEKWVNHELIPRLINLNVVPKGTKFEWDTELEMDKKLQLVIQLAQSGYYVDPTEISAMLNMNVSLAQDINKKYDIAKQPNNVGSLGAVETTTEIVNKYDVDDYNTQMDIMNAKTYSDYPQAATNNAKRALAWVEKNGWGSCGTSVGKARARQLASREPLTRDTIARMAAFERHRQNSTTPYGEGCGKLMWDCWGGSAGIEWAQRKLKQIDKE
jgi:hypothetical protein